MKTKSKNSLNFHPKVFINRNIPLKLIKKALDSFLKGLFGCFDVHLMFTFHTFFKCHLVYTWINILKGNQHVTPSK